MPTHEYKCPECESTDLSSLFGEKGNGICKVCHGEGYVFNIGDLATNMATFGYVDNQTNCPSCGTNKSKGTGQCQKCGGTGYIHLYLRQGNKRKQLFRKKTNGESPFAPSGHKFDSMDLFSYRISVIFLFTFFGFIIGGIVSMLMSIQDPKNANTVGILIWVCMTLYGIKDAFDRKI